MGLENLNERPLDYINDESGERKSLYENESTNNNGKPYSHFDFLSEEAERIMQKIKTENYEPNELERSIIEEYSDALTKKMDEFMNNSDSGMHL